MRDSLALLDQVSVLDNTKEITSDDVNSLLGRLSFDVLFGLSEKIINSKPQEAIENLDKIYNAGNEPTQILTNMLNYFKNLLIVKNCDKKSILEEITQLTPAQIETLKKQADRLETQQIVFLTERTSYYMDNNQFVAVVIKNYTNGKLVVSQCNYIKAENDKLEIVFPVPTSKYLTTDDIKLGLKEIRLLLESLKTHLYKKHDDQ